MDEYWRKKVAERPKYCGECKFIKYLEPIGIIDGDSPDLCTQANLKVYRDEKACQWGIKK